MRRGGAACGGILRTAVLVGVALAAVGAVAPPRAARAADDGLVVGLVAPARAMSALYKLFADAERFPDRALATAVVVNRSGATVSDLELRMRCDGYAEWSPWTAVRPCPPGARVTVPWHPVLDARLAQLQSSTPVAVRLEWRRASGATGSAESKVTFLGGREFVFSDDPKAVGFAGQFSNAPLLAAWVSRDDPVIKQFAALVSRRARGQAAIQGIEAGVETLRAAYELMLLNDFVYKSAVAAGEVVPDGQSFDVLSVQNVKFPRDVLRDKSGTCIELAIFLAAVGHQLGIDSKLAIVTGHCFPIFQLSEGKGNDAKTRRVPLEATSIRGGLHGTGMERVGFDKAVELASATEKRHRADDTFIEVDVQTLWMRGVNPPELPPLPDDSLARWGVTEQGLPGMTLPELGAGPARSDPSGFGGSWEGTAKARFGGADLKPCRMTLVVMTLRDGKFRLSATFVPEDGSATVQEDATAEDQDGQLVFQGTRRVALGAGGGATALSPGRGAAKVKDGRLVGKYGADGEGFASFSLARVAGTK